MFGEELRRYKENGPRKKVSQGSLPALNPGENASEHEGVVCRAYIKLL